MECETCASNGQRPGVCDRCIDRGWHETAERSGPRVMTMSAVATGTSSASARLTDIRPTPPAPPTPVAPPAFTRTPYDGDPSLKANVLDFESRLHEAALGGKANVVGKVEAFLERQERVQRLMARTERLGDSSIINESLKALGEVPRLSESPKIATEYGRIGDSTRLDRALTGEVAPIWEAMGMTKMEWRELRERRARAKSHLMEDLFGGGRRKQHLMEDLFGRVR
jgi:hypothetical protein